MGEVFTVLGGLIIFYGSYDCFLENNDRFKKSVKKIGAGIFIVGVGLLLQRFGI